MRAARLPRPGEDALKPIRFSEIVAREIPNARLRVIPDAGHAVFLEKPEELNGMVMEFLAGPS
jgi:pimeloyl-ACP methyl ester carboxylesterase